MVVVTTTITTCKFNGGGTPPCPCYYGISFYYSSLLGFLHLGGIMQNESLWLPHYHNRFLNSGSYTRCTDQQTQNIKNNSVHAWKPKYFPLKLCTHDERIIQYILVIYYPLMCCKHRYTLHVNSYYFNNGYILISVTISRI